MNKILLAIVSIIIMVFSVQANEVHKEGEAKYVALGCVACHGVAGKSVIPNYPSLNGQHALYTIKQLKDFQSGARKDPTMSIMAQFAIGFEKQIADYLAAVK